MLCMKMVMLILHIGIFISIYIYLFNDLLLQLVPNLLQFVDKAFVEFGQPVCFLIYKNILVEVVVIVANSLHKAVAR